MLFFTFSPQKPVKETMPVEDLRQRPMMDHLLRALENREDIGRYGRLTFALQSPAPRADTTVTGRTGVRDLHESRRSGLL